MITACSSSCFFFSLISHQFSYIRPLFQILCQYLHYLTQFLEKRRLIFLCPRCYLVYIYLSYPLPSPRQSRDALVPLFHLAPANLLKMGLLYQNFFSFRNNPQPTISFFVESIRNCFCHLLLTLEVTITKFDSFDPDDLCKGQRIRKIKFICYFMVQRVWSSSFTLIYAVKAYALRMVDKVVSPSNHLKLQDILSILTPK